MDSSYVLNTLGFHLSTVLSKPLLGIGAVFPITWVVTLTPPGFPGIGNAHNTAGWLHIGRGY